MTEPERRDVVSGGLLGEIVTCSMCNGSGTLHRPYRTPDGRVIDLYRDEIRSQEARPETIEAEPIGGPSLLMEAWGVIANAYDGDWELAPSTWRTAAERFRTHLHEVD